MMSVIKQIITVLKLKIAFSNYVTKMPCEFNEIVR